jgi:Flp pilus assembly pilin Flp
MLRRLNGLRIRHPELGATAVEYVLMVTMIALVVIAGAAKLGTSLIPLFTSASSGI